jgi:ribosome biogenesis GTPase
LPRRKLSQRQIERVRSIQERRRRRLAERTLDRVPDADEAEPRRGLVVARHGANLAVADEDERIFHCLSRQNIGHPVCGDRVVWQPTDRHQGIVNALLERSSVLSRPDYSGRDKPLAANITQLVVVLARRPEPSEYLLDQYLVAAEKIGVAAAIAVNKIDLLGEPDRNEFLAPFRYYEGIGYRLVRVSARLEHGLDALVAVLRAHTSILVGQSGVGKSSLIRALLPDQDLQIGRLSKATGLGRHTTSAATWYRLPSGGALIDSPGVRSFRLGHMTRADLARGFREFRNYLGHCKFADCRHDREPGCALKAAVADGDIAPQRLAHFLHMAAQLPSPAGGPD